MPRLLFVEPREGYRLYLEFADGTRGELDLAEHLWGPVFEPLRNPEEFAKVALDEFGAPTWPKGADFVPDAAYRILKGKAQGVA